jgi:hypothetical protein
MNQSDTFTQILITMAKPTNWKHYNQALINRGSLTFGIDEGTVQLWKQIKQGNLGRPRCLVI